MKKFLKYYRENKGMSLVWITLLLFVLLVFAATAIDIAYMYHAKTQLQLAADASVLAGITEISGTKDNALDGIDYGQEDARQEAWKFACLNTASGKEKSRKSDPVYLVTNTPSDCNTNNPPAAAQLNGTTNNAAGDIVVGNWDPGRTEVCPSTGVVEPFCPANGSTDLTINAIKAVARRTFDAPVANVSVGNNPVRLWLGQVFRYLGGSGDNWAFMNAKAEAIASKIRGGVGAGITMCFPGCTHEGATCEYPNVCVIDPPRVLDSGPCSGDDCYDHYAWTTLLQSPTPAVDLSYMICNQTTEEVCQEYIYTTMGSDTSVLRDFESAMYDPSYDPENKELDDDGNVTAWWMIVPIIGDEVTTLCPPGSGGWSEATIPVGYYARVRVIAICAVGTYGCRGSAYNPCSSYGGTNNSIAFDRLSCVDCDDVPDDWGFSSIPVLVK